MDWGKTNEIFKVKSSRQIYIYSIIIGTLAGLIAVLFSMALSTAEYFSLHLLAGINVQHPPGEIEPLINTEREAFSLARYSPWILFLLPIIGGLMVGLILQFLYSEASGAGTDDMVHSFHYREGKIPGRGAFFKAISTILTLASGGSGGREGPTAYIGAALGSRLGQIVKAGARARRTLLLAGTAGGLGAIFRAPLGGAMTAVEIIYREDIESDSLVPCLISSVTAYLTFTGIVGPGSLFEVGDIGLKDYRELLIYAILGLVCYGVGFIYVKLLRLIETIMGHLKLPLVFKPALGGVVIGTLALFVPEVIGSGMGYLHETINGRGSAYVGMATQSPLLSLAGFFLLLALFKILATAVTIGSGGSGGLFAPSLFIGAMLGGSVATFSQWLLPDWQLSLPSFMLVGMGAFFSGVARTPFSAMIMISDIIGSYALLPPLMMVSMITFILSSRWSLYKGQVQNRFKSPAHFWDMRLDILEELKINKQFDALNTKAIVSSQKLLRDLEDISLEIHASDFVVVRKDDDRTYCGMLSLRNVRLKSRMKEIEGLVTIADVTDTRLPYVSPEDSLADALQKITKSELDKVAVVDSNDQVLGYIRYHDIFTIYRQQVKRPAVAN